MGVGEGSSISFVGVGSICVGVVVITTNVAVEVDFGVAVVGVIAAALQAESKAEMKINNLIAFTENLSWSNLVPHCPNYIIEHPLFFPLENQSWVMLT